MTASDAHWSCMPFYIGLCSGHYLAYKLVLRLGSEIAFHCAASCSPHTLRHDIKIQSRSGTDHDFIAISEACLIGQNLASMIAKFFMSNAPRRWSGPKYRMRLNHSRIRYNHLRGIDFREMASVTFFLSLSHY